jgi:hypothetical protein
MNSRTTFRSGQAIAGAQALGAEMFVPRAGRKSKPGNGDAACGNDAALHPERADGLAPCALRSVPGLRCLSTSVASVLRGISVYPLPELSCSWWAGAKGFRLETDGGTPNISASAPALRNPVESPSNWNEQRPLTARWGGRERFPSLSLRAFATVATRRRGEQSFTLQRPQARPTSILTQRRQRYKTGAQTL